MADSDSSITTLGLGELSKKDAKEESDNDWQSIDLLLTQDEFSSGDEVGGASDDDDSSLGAPERNACIEDARGGTTKKESAATSTLTAEKTNPSTPPPDAPTDQSQSHNTPRHEKSTVLHQEKAGSSSFSSPATRTINTLSQQSSQDLRYDMTQLEKDATSVMLSLKDDDGDHDNKPSKHQKPRSQKTKSKPSQSTASKKNGKTGSSANGRLETNATSNKKKALPVVVQPNSKEKPVANIHDSNNNNNNNGNKRPSTPESTHDKQAPENKADSDQEDSRTAASSAQAAHALGRSNTTKSPAAYPAEVSNTNRKVERQDLHSDIKLMAPETSHPPDKNGGSPQRQQDSAASGNTGRPRENKPCSRPQQQRQTQRQDNNPESDIPPDTIDPTSYYIQHIIVDKEGSLGCTVAKAQPPTLLMPSPTQEYCRVKELPETCMAYSLGFRLGDWFCKDSSGRTLADYDDLVARVRSKERPLQLYVARKKGSNAVRPPAGLSVAMKGNGENKKRWDKTVSHKNTPTPTDSSLDVEIEKVVQKVVDGDGDSVNDSAGVATKRQSSSKLKSERKQTPKANSTARKQTKASSSSTSNRKSNKSTLAASHKRNSGVEDQRQIDVDGDENEEEQEDEDIEIELPNDDQVVPFCKLCTSQSDSSGKKSKSKKRAIHHALCPRNSCFHNSRADRILSKIIQGVNLGCHICAKAYELGKSSIASGESHIVACPWRDQSNNEGKEKMKQSKEKRSKASASSTTTSKKSKLAVASSSQKSSSQSAQSSKKGSRCGNNEEQPNPTSKAKRIDPPKKNGGTSRAVERKRDQPQEENARNKEQKGHDSSASKTSTKQPPQKRSPESESPGAARKPNGVEVAGEPKSTNKERPEKRQRTDGLDSAQVTAMEVDAMPTASEKVAHSSSSRGPLPQLTPPAIANAKSTRESYQVTPVGGSTMTVPTDDGGPCKSKWIRCETNPWGPDGHMDDSDVVLLTSACGLGHYETLLSSMRFEMHPFSEAAGYVKTHTFPGYDFLSLRRDSMAQRSWGFTVKRHDFGGACLVDSVDPLSPAEAATSLGGDRGQISGLRVNDMIIAINNEFVGGMTELCVSIQMETAGPWMSLVVSRYKFADYIADRIAKAEEHVVAAVDDAFSDDRHLGWIDVGASNSSALSVTTLAAKTLDVHLNMPQNPSERHFAASIDSNVSELRDKADSSDDRLDPFQEMTSREMASSASTRTTEDSPVAESQENGKPLHSSFNSGGSNKPHRMVHFHPDSMEVEEGEKHAESPAKQPGNETATGTSTNEDEGPRSEEPVICIPDRQDEIEAESNAETNSAEKVLAEQEEEANDRDSQDEEDGDQDEDNSAAASDDDDDDDDDEDDDGNPALGCVCGEIHNSRYTVFWIQCDDCDAWYNVAAKCVRFSEEEAETKGHWSCWACEPPENSDNEEEPKKQDDDGNENAENDDDEDDDGYGSEGTEERLFSRRKRRVRKAETPPKRDPNKVLEVGTVVHVHKEGSDKWGGDGRIVKSYVDEDGDQMYSVYYIIHQYTEHDISAESVAEKNWEL